MTPPTLSASDIVARAAGERSDERLSVLSDVIDWAESEAAALGAPDAGMCLQLARLALMARGARP